MKLGKGEKAGTTVTARTIKKKNITKIKSFSKYFPT